MIITFSGVDGTGKSNHMKEVINFLKLKGYKVTSLHMVHFSLFGFFSRVMIKGKSKTYKKVMKSQFNVSKKSFLKSVLHFLRGISLFFDIIHFYFVVFINKISGKVVVCDRYFYDLLVHYLFLVNKQKSLFVRFFYSIVPKPDVAFLLYLKPEQAFKRANEYNLNYFIFKDKVFGRLYSRLGGLFVKINTKGRFDSVQLEINNYLKKKLSL